MNGPCIFITWLVNLTINSADELIDVYLFQGILAQNLWVVLFNMAVEKTISFYSTKVQMRPLLYC